MLCVCLPILIRNMLLHAIFIRLGKCMASIFENIGPNFFFEDTTIIVWFNNWSGSKKKSEGNICSPIIGLNANDSALTFKLASYDLMQLAIFCAHAYILIHTFGISIVTVLHRVELQLSAFMTNITFF